MKLPHGFGNVVPKAFRAGLALPLTWIAHILFSDIYFELLYDALGLSEYSALVVYVFSLIIVFFALYFSVALLVTRLFSRKIRRISERFAVIPFNELVSTLGGGLIGLCVAAFVSVPFTRLPYGLNVVVPAGFILIFGAIGANIGHKRSNDLARLKSGAQGRAKILDTSVIIDGRILDIIQTGFVEGKIIVPNFVLDELRHIADSNDPIRKGRGRQGLDVLNKVREQEILPVEIVEWRSDKFMDVDSRLLQMAGELDAFIVTNDYNLNRVAEFQMVSVLNINELSNALKAVVIPGQEIIVSVVKTGKEPDQGVAYLNDGTMVVIEDGRRYVGEEISVTVTSILQTAAGRMIFSKLME